jgi:hypothetical protein
VVKNRSTVVELKKMADLSKPVPSPASTSGNPATALAHHASSGSVKDIGDACWGRAVSFLTIFEWATVHVVSKRWNKLVCPYSLVHFRSLDLSQFWAVLGDDNSKLNAAVLAPSIAQMNRLKSVSFSFCHNLTDQLLIQWLKEIPTDSKASIVNVNLFFCRKLSNLAVLNVAKMFPNLQCLNLTSCFNLTDACVSQIVKNCPRLRVLVLANNEKFTDEILIDLTAHPALEILDIQRTKLMKETVDDYRQASPKLTIIGPQLVIVPSGNARLQKRASLQ